MLAPLHVPMGWLFFPRSWAERGRGGEGWGLPPHLAGLVMMRAEKSKRFLLIFRRVLTSSSSSLTWIVRCSWSPIRFCGRKKNVTEELQGPGAQFCQAEVGAAQDSDTSQTI